MTDPIRDAAIEAAAKAMADDWNPDRDPILTAMFRDYAQSAVDAALAVARPAYRAEALRDAARGQGPYPLNNWKQVLRDRADEEDA